MPDLQHYRARKSERDRTDDLLRVIPRNRGSVLDIGTRDGHFARALTQYFSQVTALDLQRPNFEIPGVQTTAGDVTKLEFPANSFDCVFCSEVLEHIVDVEEACNEIIRVAKYEIIIGVPFKQDIRCGRTTCRSCGKVNPPWGHVNSFDEERLSQLFSGLAIISKSFVGITKEVTNPISAFLMDFAGNPWGTYDQDESCIYCGANLIFPGKRNAWQMVCSAAAVRLNRIQSLFTTSHGNWIHLVLSKGHE